jgi:hypothetical protein
MGRSRGLPQAEWPGSRSGPDLYSVTPSGRLSSLHIPVVPRQIDRCSRRSSRKNGSRHSHWSARRCSTNISHKATNPRGHAGLELQPATALVLAGTVPPRKISKSRTANTAPRSALRTFRPNHTERTTGAVAKHDKSAGDLSNGESAPLLLLSCADCGTPTPPPSIRRHPFKCGLLADSLLARACPSRLVRRRSVFGPDTGTPPASATAPAALRGAWPPVTSGVWHLVPPGTSATARPKAPRR